MREVLGSDVLLVILRNCPFCCCMEQTIRRRSMRRTPPFHSSVPLWSQPLWKMMWRNQFHWRDWRGAEIQCLYSKSIKMLTFTELVSYSLWWKDTIVLCGENYLPSPSSSLLYSAISISSRVLMSSSILYSWLWFSMSLRRQVSCSSRLVTWHWRPWSCIAYRASVSAKVPSSDAFWKRKGMRKKTNE